LVKIVLLRIVLPLNREVTIEQAVFILQCQGYTISKKENSA